MGAEAIERLDGAQIAGIVTEDGIVDLSDHRASALPVPEPEPEQERSHPLVGKCRIRGCSGKLRDHTPDDSDGSVLELVCDKCRLAFRFTPAPWRVAQTQALRTQRIEREGRAS